MTRYEELTSILTEVKEPKRTFIFALLKDFVWLEEQIEELRKYPRYMIKKDDPTQQKKLEVHNMIKDFQAQKNEIITKILRTLDNDKLTGASDLAKALAAFTDNE